METENFTFQLCWQITPQKWAMKMFQWEDDHKVA